VVFGGYSGGGLQSSEEFDGIAWAAGGGLSNARRYSPGSAGEQAAALCTGGYETSDNSNKTELYSGVSWSLSGTLNTARRQLAAAGTVLAAVCFGGYVAAASNVTEEFDGAVWSVVNTMVTAVKEIAGCGTQTAALTCGGNNNITEPKNTTAQPGLSPASSTWAETPMPWPEPKMRAWPPLGWGPGVAILILPKNSPVPPGPSA